MQQHPVTRQNNAYRYTIDGKRSSTFRKTTTGKIGGKKKKEIPYFWGGCKGILRRTQS